MLIQGQVGAPAGTNAPGATPAIRQGQLGDLVVSELHGRYYEATYRRNMFSGALAAAQSATTGGITTQTAYVGLVLYNPPSSPVNLVIQKAGLASVVAQTNAIAFGLAQGFSQLPPQSTTAVTVKNNYVTGPAPVGQLYSAATFGITTTAPVSATFTHVLASIGTGALTTSQITPTMYDLEGSIVVPPTGFVQFYFSAGVTASSIFGSLAWEEVPL